MSDKTIKSKSWWACESIQIVGPLIDDIPMLPIPTNGATGVLSQEVVSAVAMALIEITSHEERGSLARNNYNPFKPIEFK